MNYRIGGTPTPRDEVEAFLTKKWSNGGHEYEKLVAEIVRLNLELQRTQYDLEDFQNADDARYHVDNCREDDCTDDRHNFR